MNDGPVVEQLSTPEDKDDKDLLGTSVPTEAEEKVPDKDAASAPDAIYELEPKLQQELNQTRQQLQKLQTENRALEADYTKRAFQE
jgi:hypothetical protein